MPVVPPQVIQAPAAVMTHWLTHAPAAGFQVLEEYELRDEGDAGAVIRCRNQPADSEEILGHLKAGKRVGKLALQFQERMTAVVHEDLSVKRLRFLEGVLEEADQTQTQDEAARMDADFVLMAGELEIFLTRLAEAFGGMADPGP